MLSSDSIGIVAALVVAALVVAALVVAALVASVSKLCLHVGHVLFMRNQ